MNKIKSRLEWIKQLPEPYYTKALRYISCDDLYTGCRDMEEALSGGFIFYDTEDGANYWMDVLSLYSGYDISSSHTKETNCYKIGDTVFVKTCETISYFKCRINEIIPTNKGNLFLVTDDQTFANYYYLESEIDILTIKK